MTVTTGAAAEATSEHGARVLKVPPPLYYGAAFAAGMVLNAVTVPLAIGARPGSAVLGAAGLTAGALVGLAGVREVARHHTTIVPHHAVSTLVSTGVYRFSRNPMYLSLCLLNLGIGLLLCDLVPVVLTAVLALVLHNGVILREERYLGRKFGGVYSEYRLRVRRWL